MRVTNAALTMARAIPLGAQAHVAVETVEVLRKYGLKGIYGLIFRKEFLAAADLLCRALGINKTSWPLSVHELSAAIFYALAQHRAVRGMNPEREHHIHSLRQQQNDGPFLETRKDECQPESTTNLPTSSSGNDSLFDSVTDASAVDAKVLDETDVYDPLEESVLDFMSLPDDSVGDSHKRGLHDPSFVPVCDPVPNDAMSSVLFYAPLALNFVYAQREVDMQLLAAQQGWRLVYAQLDQDNSVDRPGSALFVHERHKIACFAIRGTTTINDVITDIRQMPVSFPEVEIGSENTPEGWTPIFSGRGLAVSGMARAATTLFREHMDVLLLLASRGYKIRITGHSLGGGVATLLGALVLRHQHFAAAVETARNNRMDTAPTDETAGRQIPDRLSHHSSPLLVYGFGTPACVDAALSDEVRAFVTTVVLHDDVVPRLNPTSIRGLLKHLLHIRETWVKAHLTDDLMAITERAKTVWAPRWKSGFTLRGHSSLKKYCKKQIQNGTKGLLSVSGRLAGITTSSTVEHRPTDAGSPGFDAITTMDGEKTVDPSDQTIIRMERQEDNIDDTVRTVNLPRSNGERDREGHPTEMSVLEFIGAMDQDGAGESACIVVDGDEFYDPEETLLEPDQVQLEPQAAPYEAAEDDEYYAAASGETDEEDEPMLEEGTDEQNEAVVLEETPLPRMYIPGMIIHVYTHRGAFKAAYVPRTFRELRRISLAGNMLSDHTCKAYYEGLLEVQTVRRATEELPRWTPFDEDRTCTCCASRFTWASTSDTAAQEARDKHNCRSCGTLVCNPCSSHRIPLPSIGLTVPVRVCDRCYNDIGGVLTGEHEGAIDDAGAPERIRRQRQRARRSLVVDELAERIQATVAVT